MRRCFPNPLDCSTFLDVLESRAAGHPDDGAYTFLPDGEGQEQSANYRQVERRAKAIAAALQSLGAEGGRALLLYPPGLEYVAAVLGCLSGGVVAVPAYPPRASPSRANERIVAIVKDAGPAIVLTVSKLRATVEPCLAGAGVRCVATDEFEDAGAEGWRRPPILPGDLALLQYTSGSTATPKGVMLTHANLIHNSRLVYGAFGHSRRSLGVSWLPPYHDMGLAAGILQPLFGGGLSVLMPPAAFLQRPVRWLKAISRYKGTTSGGPNFAYELCARTIAEADRAELDLGSWDVAFNGAEPVSAGTLQRFAETFASCGFRREAFYPCYGLAEATLLVSGGTKGRAPVLGLPPGDDAGAKQAGPAVGCGQAQGDGTIAVVDPVTHRRCADATVGELWLRGGSVAQGYWANPQETDRVFNAKIAGGDDLPYLRTGDLGFLREGELFVTGRLKDLINIRGIKHHPQDIERTVQECHSAHQPAGAAAFSVDVDGQEQLVVCQELQRSQRGADPQQMIAAIRAAVAEQHELDVYAVVLLKPGQVHKTSSGKVQRFACRADFVAGALDPIAEWRASAAAPRRCVAPEGVSAPKDADSLAAWMIEQLAAAMGVKPAEIDPDEPFARYGLDSVKAASFAGELATLIGREVPLMLFWDYPSITAMSRHLMPTPSAAAA